ncbi:glycerate kinase [Nocardioides marmoriginsengisoli]|uniref:Glycerate kinase n=1 Tax=Nocardioides marmoriginsengisoli TaxID=661483 RepID=A0A3N0CLE1_9ACTN|nr:glycerate kinase [Nocardioides marmoriginsengisoli]RNL64268.1 glycerate kinase [Nocardioides marmoriginsengisoli]
MRVVIAPDKFAGTLSAVEAAAAIGAGWIRRVPDAEIVEVPMSDGGPGFVDVLHAALGGELVATTVPDPYGEPVPAAVLVVGATAYVETAQAVGLHLTPEPERRPLAGSSRGVGELLLAALDAGARRVVIGAGGTATNDGGAGLLAALGATADKPLDAGPVALGGIAAIDLAAARERLAGVELVLASDVDVPLLGLLGATKTFGPQKGLSEEELLLVDGRLRELAEATDRKLADAKGAGAAGGIGYALMLLGATRTAGVDVVAEAVDLAGHLAGANLVITGEGAFDFSSRSGKVPYGVAQAATSALVPCIALAGQVLVGSREMRALGIEAAYSVVDRVGAERAFSAPAEALADLAERVARTWGR